MFRLADSQLRRWSDSSPHPHGIRCGVTIRWRDAGGLWTGHVDGTNATELDVQCHTLDGEALKGQRRIRRAVNVEYVRRFGLEIFVGEP